MSPSRFWTDYPPGRVAVLAGRRYFAPVWLVWLALFLPSVGWAADAVVMVLGDSLSAGYGIAIEAGWVSKLEDKLKSRSTSNRIVNASISGDTSAGGLARVHAALARHQPNAVVLELGANDGLNGLPLDQTEANLVAIIRACMAHEAKVLLVGVRLPPNYGPPYLLRFKTMFEAVALRTGVQFVPRMLDGIGERRELMQADGIHPTAQAQTAILANLWPALEQLLNR